MERNFSQERISLSCMCFISEEHKKYGLAKRWVTLSLFFWTIFILNLALPDTVNYGYSDTNSAPFVADLILFCFELSLSEDKPAKLVTFSFQRLDILIAC